MNADQLNTARNPLFPAAMQAIQRAAKQARQEALRTHTGIVVVQAASIKRIDWNQLSGSAGGNHKPSQLPSEER